MISNKKTELKKEFGFIFEKKIAEYIKDIFDLS